MLCLKNLTLAANIALIVSGVRDENSERSGRLKALNCQEIIIKVVYSRVVILVTVFTIYSVEWEGRNG